MFHTATTTHFVRKSVFAHFIQNNILSSLSSVTLNIQQAIPTEWNKENRGQNMTSIFLVEDPLVFHNAAF